MSDRDGSLLAAGGTPASPVLVGVAPTAPEFGFVLAVWWSGAWRWLVAALMLGVPAGMGAGWYLHVTGFDFIAWSMTGVGTDRFIGAVWWVQFWVHVPASLWAARAALWRHGVVKGR